MKTALIFGITGQDGAYLAKLLLEEGYSVVGTSRDLATTKLHNLERLHIASEVVCKEVQPADFRSVFNVFRIVRPDLVFNLSGQTSVGLSFDQPVESVESIATATLNILESIRMDGQGVRFVNAGSSECFGERDTPASESSAFRPRSPYAVAKSAAFWHVSSYRLAYGLHASTAIMSNHESPLRGERFVSQKIIAAAKNCKNDSSFRVRMGDLSVVRHWGWAPDYVRALLLMAKASEADDYIVAAEKATSLVDFAEYVFNYYGLSCHEFMQIDQKLFRPLELRQTLLSTKKIKEKLQWEPTIDFGDMLEKLINGKLY
ncbi:MAG: GDP-mannose 4,6-dehydratase [Chitinophagia bacterium]|nr:GDP-mannose 4,6-dehydratase [Chitinophagia bacterium]